MTATNGQSAPDGRSVTFSIDPESGLPPYLQLIRQIRQAMRVGLLRQGDQLPTVKDLAEQLALNPNTVLKAYREMHYRGLVDPQPGVGTFIGVTLADAALAVHGPVSQELRRWLADARRAGLDDETIEALVGTTLRTMRQGDAG